MKQIEQKFEKQYIPIEPGWNLEKEELVKNMQVSDKAYNPSEPEGVFDKINPYRGSLKYIIENFDKNTWRTLSECAALVVAPAGLLYVKKEFNNVEREVCLEQGKKFREHKFGKDFDHPIYMIETAKTFLAYFLSSSAAKIIW